MAWRDVFVRAIRGEAEPGVLTVFKAVTTGTEREVEAATGAWVARRRESREAREERAHYEESARRLEDKVRRSPGLCYMPGIDD
jgi:hypothetical protein